MVAAGSSNAIGLDQIDTFEDATTQFWGNGGAGAPPVVNIATGGPAGANDNYLRITADGAGAGRFLTAFNRSQWLGNYIAAGVNAIELDLRNFGAVDLSIRLAFKSSIVSGAPGYVSAPFVLPVGSGWQHAVFSINIGSMTPVNGPNAFSSFFSNWIAEVRIINSTVTDDLNGQIVVGQLGVDNVHAIPEPASALLMSVGLVGVGAGIWRRRG